jgi:hypothetical protein
MQDSFFGEPCAQFPLWDGVGPNLGELNFRAEDLRSLSSSSFEQEALESWKEDT